MSGLYACGACCFVLSIWGVVQLVIMGICYKIESSTLVIDVMPEESAFDTIDDYLKEVKYNFAATARNCWIAAVIYLVLILLSLMCLWKARRTAKRKAEEDEDDEIFCASTPQEKQEMIKMFRTKKV